MARIDVIMPQMGESIAEGTLSKWLKKLGDEVKRDEPIFEISTDKVDAEIPAPSAGVLVEVIVTEGQTVAVQTVVARIETEKGAAIGAAPAAPPAGTAGAGPATPMADGASTKAPVSSGASNASPPAGAPPQAQHATPPAAARHPQPAPPAGFTPSASGNTLEDRLRTRSSPLVRKIAAEHGIELASLQGSGVAGRVTRKDIMSVVESGAPAAAGQPTGAHAPQPWPGDVVEPMTRMRTIISEHMVAARRTAAHVTSFFEIDLTRVSRIRAKKRAEFEQQTGQKLTYLPFIISAVVQGLQRFPILNSVVSGGNIIYRKQYNIGIAVALDWGLIVPVIKHAETLSLSGLTRNLNDLASRARAKKLNPAEVQDATFTITNPGVFGSLMGTPIIPQPTVAILGLGAIEKRPKVITGPDGEDTIAIRTCAYFSISFDHRVIDGAVADEFLASVKKTLESFPEQVS